MNRLIPIFAALAALAGPLALGGGAAAKDDRRDERSARASERAGERGGPVRERGGERGERRAGDDRRVYPNRGGPPQTWRGGRDPTERNAPRSYDPRDDDERLAPYPAPSARRGGYMPPQSGGPVADYGRYRLRPPPRGYVWVRTGNGYAMVSEESGRVFDVVPY